MIFRTKVENGELRGAPSSDPNVAVFRGIPFAAPPVGENRWRAPQPVENWEGIREAIEFGNIPMQRTPGYDERDWGYRQQSMGEDCLYLNVWTPAHDPSEKLPVMVWIFGGGYTVGSPAEPVFEGTKFASRKVVFVSLTYRLNVFAWFAHPELTAKQYDEGCTNFAFLDQVAALQWVQRNIHAFGGDPDNVTLFGHSAGGGSVIYNLLTPRTEGLFHKAIVLSGGGVSLDNSRRMQPLAKAEQQGVEFLKFLGVETIEEARKIDARTLFDKSVEFGQMSADPNGGLPNFRWGYSLDGNVIKEDNAEGIYKLHYHDVPIITGHAAMDFPIISKAESLEEFEKEARAQFSDRADEYLDIVDFKCGDLETVRANATYAMQGAASAAWCERAARAGKPIYGYNFDHPRPEDRFGTSHGVDVDYCFDNLVYKRAGHKGIDYDVARQANLYFANFAKTGDPNGVDIDGEPLPRWELYTKEEPREMTFKGGAHMEEKQTKLMSFLVDFANEKNKAEFGE